MVTLEEKIQQHLNEISLDPVTYLAVDIHYEDVPKEAYENHKSITVFRADGSYVCYLPSVRATQKWANEVFKEDVTINTIYNYINSKRLFASSVYFIPVD